MLELMLAGPKGSVSFKSGPGNKVLLAGNLTDGWFGLVDSNELPLPAIICRDGGSGIATMPQQATVPLQWMKAVINGKFIFVANAPFNTSVILDLYNRGQVFGTDDFGSSPPSNRYNDQNQLNVIVATDNNGKIWGYKLRLLNHSSNDKPASASATTTELAEAESFKLYSHVISGVTPDDGKRWDSLVNGKDYFASQSYGRTLVGSLALIRAQNGVRTAGTWAANNGTYNWFPVLEVIDLDTELVPAADVILEGQVVKPPALTATNSTTQLTPAILTVSSNTEVSGYTTPAVNNTRLLSPAALIQANSSELSAQSQLNG